MAPLILLLGLFLLLTLAGRLAPQLGLSLGLRGRISIAVMFVFTGVSHFIFTEEMAVMVPPIFPEKTLLIYFTGICEIAGVIGLLIPSLRPLAGWALVIFLLGVLPANIYSAMHSVGMGGHVKGPVYLWFRVPLQIFFISWILFFLRRP
jgi:uncharacterized membrane protein